MDIFKALFFTSFLVILPLESFAAVFDVKDESQIRTALNIAGRNKEADIINILSDMTLAEGLKYIPENYPLTINGNGFRIIGNEKSRCLDIKDKKVALSNAHISIHNLTFSHGSDLAAGGLILSTTRLRQIWEISVCICGLKDKATALKFSIILCGSMPTKL